LQSWLSLLSGILQVAGFFPYGYATIKGRTKPAKASWLIWAVLDTITLVGMYAANSLNGQIIGAVVGVWVIVALAFNYGKPGWAMLDVVCLAGGAFGIALWQMFDNPTLAIVTSLTVVAIGAIPTITNAFVHPEEEDRIAWLLYTLAAVAAIFAIPKWDLDNAAQPITFFVVEAIMMWLLWVRPRSRRVTAEFPVS